ncbi:2'-5' RNA ligase family protein [Solilutibacter silvestris]|uniref:2'-5' RNA ligase n=1 Tax=Solilutibacter silvestris TaxID=1645665 RepID=A0A2K1Q124_9GAMM|nr:hypothetical protein [Lysobacter silvestris]PNS08745.1 hypothetical protein Lysil_0374 [Lysobacter silvestris]
MASVERALFVAMPGQQVRDKLLDAVRSKGLDHPLGSAMFDPLNWHQSLSDRHWSPSAERIEQLKRAGSRINGAAFTMRFDRIGGGDHWVFGVKGGRRGLKDLLDAVQRGLGTEGLADNLSHSPHITLSYNAPHPLQQVEIEPVEWLVDELLLVIGGGSEPYRYRVVERWPLQAADQVPGAQLGLL